MLERTRGWFFALTLARKLTVLATATTAVSMTFLCAGLGWYDTGMLRARAVEDAGIVADMLAVNSTASLTFGDARAATEMLRTFAVDEHIAVAAILQPDGRVFTRYDRQSTAVRALPTLHVVPGDLRERERRHRFVGSRLIMHSPIVLDGERLGTAYIEIALGELYARLWLLWRTLAVGLLGAVMLAGLIASRLQRSISAPVLHLTGITRAVIRDRNYGLRAVGTTTDEIGELAKGLNEMLDHIQQRDTMLERHRQELERTVSARTAELKANMERYRLLVESTHAVPWEIEGSTYVFSYISPQVTKLLGYESRALVRRQSLPDLIDPDDRARILERLAALSTTRDGDLDIDYRMRTADNRVIEVRSVVTAHAAAADRTVVLRGITVDVTRQRKLEMELRQAQKLESVGRLAAGVAHEINTPIQFISDSVHFVRDAMSDLGRLIEEYKGLEASLRGGVAAAVASDVERIARITRETDLDYLMENVPKALERSLDGLNRVATIVRSMKEFAHPDRQEMTPVNLNQAIQSTITIARNEYKYVADLETDLGALPLVTCHPGDVNQVILNILVNAAHAIEEAGAGANRRGRISVRTRQEDDEVVVSVSDTGCGIPEGIRERVFDPFFTTKEVGRGTGQGLAIARTVITEKHGGKLTFESEVGKGTTFVVRLPIDGRGGQDLAA